MWERTGSRGEHTAEQVEKPPGEHLFRLARKKNGLAEAAEHAELAWVLNCTARMGWLSRMTQWKDKSGKNKEGSSVALFDSMDMLVPYAPKGVEQIIEIPLTAEEKAERDKKRAEREAEEKKMGEDFHDIQLDEAIKYLHYDGDDDEPGQDGGAGRGREPQPKRPEM